MVQIFIFEFDRWMVMLGGHFLIKDILDVMGPVGTMKEGFFNGQDKGSGAILILEAEQPRYILFDGLIGIGQGLEIITGLLSQR